MISSRDFVGALEKGLQVIEAFDSATARLTLSDIAARVGITRAAARRFLLTLTELGYAEHDGRYFSLTPKVLGLSRAHLGGNSIYKLAQPVLDSMASKTMESASAGILSGTELVFVARAQSPRPVSIHVTVGTRIPAFCAALGRVLLGEIPEAEVRERLAYCPPDRLNTKTSVNPADIIRATREAHLKGYATCVEEFESGLNAIAVPVRNVLGEAVFSIGLSVPANRMSEEEMIKYLLPELNASAAKLASMC
ncbi:MAG: Transcriptional regulator [Noviherbaspirillum sp.]|jgi:IclR family pca regulon transcriptional regulator|nr:Transcriptional regulator [Noviherbaspirillum sp.]